MVNNQGSATVFIVVALALVLSVFWFLGREAYEVENLTFSIIPEEEKQGGQAATVQISLSESQENATNELAQTIAEQYLNPISLSTNEEVETEELIESFYNSLEDAAPENIPYITVSDINTVPGSESATQDYIEIVTKIEKDLVTEKIGKEAQLYTKYALTGTNEEVSNTISELRKSASIYKEIASRLSRMSVPEDLAERHKIMTNAILDLSYGSQYLADGMLDPLLSILGVHFYQQGVLARARLQ